MRLKNLRNHLRRSKSIHQTQIDRNLELQGLATNVVRKSTPLPSDLLLHLTFNKVIMLAALELIHALTVSREKEPVGLFSDYEFALLSTLELLVTPQTRLRSRRLELELHSFLIKRG
jgi:hypothetical protein